MKIDIKYALRKYWYAYVIWIIVAALLGVWIVSTLTSDSDVENLAIFIGGSVNRPEEFRDGVDAKRSSYIKHIDMYCYSPSSEVYSTFFLTYLSTADVFILPESKIRDVGIKAKFAPLDKDFVSSLGDTELWTEDDIAYAIKMYDKDVGSGVCSFCDYTAEGATAENYRLAFGKNSKHLSYQNGNNGAYGIAAVLMSI